MRVNLPRRYCMLIDKDDYYNLIYPKTVWVDTKGYPYVGSRIDYKLYTQRISRIILGLGPYSEDNREADHINRDPMDNRRENLRILTRAENLQNKKKYNTNNKYRGVYRSGRKFRAGVRLNGKLHYLGMFEEQMDAVEAVKKFRSENMPYATD